MPIVIKSMRINLIEYFETDLIAKLKTTYGYNYTLLKVYHNENEINEEKSFPYLRYYLDDEIRDPYNEDGSVMRCTTILNVFGCIKNNLQITNTNTELVNAEKLTEDLLGYFENGKWITSGKTTDLPGKKFDYGKVGGVIVKKVTRPYLKSNNNYEVALEVEIEYIQNFKNGIS